MNWKKIFVATSSVLYLILISVLIYYYRKEFICHYESVCLRFCSTDTEKYSDKFLYDSLKKNNLSHHYDIEFDDLSIIRGRPTCHGSLINIEDEEKTESYYSDSSPNPRVFDSGDVYDRGLSFSINKNCLELEDESDNVWSAMVCTNESIPNPSLSWIMTILSVIILASTITIYSYFSELRDFPGKMIILFLSSVLCSYLVIPGIANQGESAHLIINLLLAYGFTSGHLWLNSMILNNYFRCRDFRSSKPKEDRFKPFVIYVSIFTTFATLFILFEMLVMRDYFPVEFISIIHYYLVLNDSIVLIVTSIIIRNISKHIDLSERVQLEKEKKLFWIYVKLFAIMFVTWSTQIFALQKDLNEFGCLTASFMMLFSAVNISGLFIGRRKVRNLLFDKYNRTFNVHDDSY
ncbi:G-protein coupled receptor Mth-like isoform X2 [Chironomus tepperi]|uniref:G-protein coupled receptor Mth-like isoform X2 n=1 Tax=Chironomus tepperi TaxID=113505 RepID=UPI00391FA104